MRIYFGMLFLVVPFFLQAAPVGFVATTDPLDDYTLSPAPLPSQHTIQAVAAVEKDSGFLSSVSLQSAAELFGRALEAGDPESTDDTEVAKIPVPAAIWLFGSGVFGLLGMARQRRLQ